MNEEQQMVRDFHERFRLTRSDSPTFPGEVVHRVRMNLIDEEVAELRNAGHAHDLVEVADALADLLYVVYGTAVSYGIDVKPIFAEIHRSNMSKGDATVFARPDGKIPKGANYSPPRVAEILEAQMEPEAVAIRAG